GYGFFRSLGARGHWQDTRRVFGGATTRLEDYPEVCILLDRFMAPRCSGSVLTRYWILTAAHCITPNLGFAKYNTRTPMRTDVGDVVALRYLYKHPDYKVVQEDVGRGMDVTVLNHDLGLAHTRAPMALAQHSPVPPLRAILSYDPNQLFGEEVQVLGFGRTEASNKGEELLTVFLRLVECDRNGWRHCVCGVSRSLELPSGVCSGDSGGPVVYRGVQIGVTSMGPLSCASDANETFPLGATSVFTAVFPYRDIINRTIREADSSMRRSVPTSSAPTIAAKFIATLANIILLVETNIIFV
ncbi:chymotrypsin-1-like, partial [Plodia interpunctella]|uniref:chymotrypsin-1-like n=1 Tax=Plodia interpunctella TaxID=58824 RepID=UPI0023683969